MKFKVWSRYEPEMLRVIVETQKPEKIRLIAYDKDQANTVFMDAIKIVNGREDLVVRMPLAPNYTILNIYNESVGESEKGQDNSFKVVDIKKEELKTTLSRTKMDTSLVRSFVNFCQKFVYNAGWISPKDYYSTTRQFKIEYLPIITSSKGERMATPARVSTANGRIQVSQQAFVPMTIPMRMAILCHEFSHYYLNSDIADETEADLNALTIYLGLGFPIKEAYAAFGETFMGAPTQLNKERYEIINKFIRDYVDEHKIEDVYAKKVNQ